MKVLLISANTEQINMPVLPLGMAFVARAADDAGHEVSQINISFHWSILEKRSSGCRFKLAEVVL